MTPGGSEWDAEVASEKKKLYVLRTQSNTDDTVYFYVLVDPRYEPDLKLALDGKRKFDLRSYGEIVECGYGEPSEEVKQQLRETYGADV